MTNSTITSHDLSQLALSYATALPWRAWFTPHSRWARRMAVTADHEVWLLGWLPGQGTELHDHGGNQRPCPAGFAVASGTLTEYTVAPGQTPRLHKRQVSAGQSATVGERTIHAMVNKGDTPAVSVHVYAPRLSLMRRYLFNESGLWLASMIRPGADW